MPVEASGHATTETTISSQVLRISAVALALLAAAPVLAQEATDEAAATEAAPASATQDNNTDWGWIGLLGLIGLADLGGRRQDTASTIRI